METSTVSETAPEAAAAAQLEGKDSSQDSAPGREGAAAAQSKEGAEARAGDSGRTEAEQLTELLARGEKDPNVVYTDKELDLFDKYRDGTLKPAKPGKVKKEKATEETEGKDGQDAEAPQPDAKAKDDADKPDPIAEALKEVGAEKPEDLVPKIKELRKALTGKDAQAAVQLKKDNEALMVRFRNERSLWDAVRSGDPAAVQHALDFVEKAYGVKLVPAAQAGGTQRTAAGAPAAGGADDFLIPEDKFIDEESAKLANAVIGRLAAKVKSLEEGVTEFKTEKTRLQQETAHREAISGQIDEMTELAGLKGLEELAKIPNLKQAIREWYVDKKDDPRLEILDQVIDVANKEKVSLKFAWAWMRAQGADLEIAQAKEKGRKEAYDQKPSRTLSGMGGKGHQAYQQYTDEQFEEMSKDFKLVPEEWYGADDALDRTKVPRRAHKYFFPPDSPE